MSLGCLVGFGLFTDAWVGLVELLWFMMVGLLIWCFGLMMFLFVGLGVVYFVVWFVLLFACFIVCD